jgi:hypothetical protein
MSIEPTEKKEREKKKKIRNTTNNGHFVGACTQLGLRMMIYG